VAEPALLALDFDGVVCDGMAEYVESSWRACRRLWPATPPVSTADLLEAFARVRPLVESGWEMPVLVHALLTGAGEADLARDWRPEDRLAHLAVARESVAATLDDVRDAWIARDPAGWLAHHRFYPGVAQHLRALAGRPCRVAVVSTKEGRFVQALLRAHGVELGPGTVFGRETRRPKREILRALLAGMGLSSAALWFVEDRLVALRDAAADPGLADARLFLAAWGYNTPDDRGAAAHDPRLTLLTLERFTGPFPGWVA